MIWLAATSTTTTSTSSSTSSAPTSTSVAHHVAHATGVNLVHLLPYALPLLVVAPLVGFIVIASTFRTRRSAFNTAVFFVLVTWVLALTALAALAARKGLYSVAYQWINVALAFTGPQQFQGFGIDITLQLDHAGLIALGALCVITAAALVWSAQGARGEPGPVRWYALLLLGLTAASGAVLSGDLAELFAFWAAAGAVTYLILANRWGQEPDARRAVRALAVPVFGDLALLGGIALLYSRYGRTDLQHLQPALHVTPGWGLKSLTVAAILIGVGAAARVGVFPFLSWNTATARLSAAGVALTEGTWAILAGLLLYRTAPIFHGAGPQAVAVLAALALVGVMLAVVVALAGNDVGKVAAAAGSAQAALGVYLFAQGEPGLALVALAAGGLARTAALLAAGTARAALRTADMALMGEGWRRLPGTSAVLLAAGIALAVAALPGAEPGFKSVPAEVGGAIAIGAVALVALRPYLGVAHGPLPRRRAFDPDRVREGRPGMVAAAAVAAGVGLALLLVFLVPGSARYLGEPGTRLSTFALLGAAAFAAGLAVSAFLFGGRAEAAEGQAGRLGTGWEAWWGRALGAAERWLLAPVGGWLGGWEDRGLLWAEGQLAAGAGATGRFAAPALIPVLVALGVLAVVGLVAGLVLGGAG